MKRTVAKLSIAGAVIGIVLLAMSYPVRPALRSAPIDIKVPKATFQGTKENIRVANLRKLPTTPRPPFLAPVGTKNVALGKVVFAGDESPIISELEMITDGDKEAADGSYVELGPFLQHVSPSSSVVRLFCIYWPIRGILHSKSVLHFHHVLRSADPPWTA